MSRPKRSCTDAMARFAADPAFRGGNVTIPWKASVIPLLSRVDDEARASDAVNTIFRARPGGALEGANTDGAGAWSALMEVCEGSALPKHALFFGRAGPRARWRRDSGGKGLTIAFAPPESFEDRRIRALFPARSVSRSGGIRSRSPDSIYS